MSYVDQSQAFKSMEAQIATGNGEVHPYTTLEYHGGNVIAVPHDWGTYFEGKWLAGKEKPVTLPSQFKKDQSIVMEGVREYGEGDAVELAFEGGRFVVVATNQSGYDATKVDLLDMVMWIGKVGNLLVQP